jgi:hypothetical protein
VKRQQSKQWLRLRVSLLCVPALLALATSAPEMAGHSSVVYALQPDPDLCTIFQQLSGSDPVHLTPGVGDPGATTQCELNFTGQNPKFANMSIHRWDSPAGARSQLDPLVKTQVGWVATSSYGDPGYAYDQPERPDPVSPQLMLASELYYARDCYTVFGQAGYDFATNNPIPSGAIRNMAAAVDRELQKYPCTQSPTTASPTPGGNVDLTVDHIEAVQVVQDDTNSVPLVANKTTLVRVFVKVGGAKGPVGNVTGVLHGSPGGAGDVTVQPNYPITAPLALDRSDPTHSLLFLLPPELTADGTYPLEVTVNPDKTVPETDYTNNTYSKQLVFIEKPTLRVGYVRVGYKPPGAAAFAWPTGPLQEYSGFMHAIFPIADKDKGIQYYPEPYEIRVTRPLTRSVEHLSFAWSVRALYDMMSADKPDQLVAWLPDDPSIGMGGMAEPTTEFDVPHVVVALDRPTYQESAQNTLAHEIGHNLGLKHTATHDPAPCSFAENHDPSYWGYSDGKGTAHEIGYDSRNDWLVSPNDYDVMTYCAATNTWISPFHYKRLFDSNLQAHGITKLPTEWYIVIRTRVKADRAGGLIWARRLPTNQGGVPATPGGGSFSPGLGVLADVAGLSSRAPIRQGSGDYCLRYTDAGGGTISEYCTNLTFDDHRTGAPLDEAGFSAVLPYPDRAAHLALLDHGQEVASLSASSSNPTVTITSPGPGDTWSGAHTLTWSATDPGGNGLSYDVLYSADGGKGWFPLSIEQTETRFDFSTAEIAPGNQTYFRVVASSGLNTTIADVGPVIVPPQPGSPQLPPPPVAAAATGSGGSTIPWNSPAAILASYPLLVYGGIALVALVLLLLAVLLTRRSRPQPARPGQPTHSFTPRFCPRCGTPLTQQGQRFCTRCGQPIPDV